MKLRGCPQKTLPNHPYNLTNGFGMHRGQTNKHFCLYRLVWFGVAGDISNDATGDRVGGYGTVARRGPDVPRHDVHEDLRPLPV